MMQLLHAAPLRCSTYKGRCSPSLACNEHEMGSQALEDRQVLTVQVAINADLLLFNELVNEAETNNLVVKEPSYNM